MPGRDGTGPMGQGAMSGKGFGACQTGWGRGYARGMGRGMGPGAGYGCRKPGGRFMTGMASGWTDKEVLEDQQEFLKSRLDEVSKQLEEINK